LDKVKTAIVCPPTIYGPGRGPDNQRSVQIYNSAKYFLENQQAFKVGKGDNIWHYVHVQDLSNLYLLLGEAAASGGPPATWNEQGYYLAENGSFVWGEVLESMAQIAYKKGLLPNDKVESYTADEVNKLFPHGGYSIGTNSRGVSIRGKELLGWKPVMRNIHDELNDAVDSEARLLGLTKGHAEKVQE
jgi:nucleoside-diphosphate-sugar epimerase